MSDYPHPIRLRGPWDLFVPDSGAEAQPRRVTPPCDWRAALGAEFRGTARFRRFFHAPDRLMPHERLWLVVEGANERAAVGLNGAALGEFAGAATTWEHAVTERIVPRNELTLDVVAPTSVGALGAVRLEVRWKED